MLIEALLASVSGSVEVSSLYLFGSDLQSDLMFRGMLTIWLSEDVIDGWIPEQTTKEDDKRGR